MPRVEADSWSVYQTEQMKEICAFLGIDWEKRSKKIVITFENDKPVLIEHTYYAEVEATEVANVGRT